MKKADVVIWMRDEYLANARVQELIKGYGGICVFGDNAKAIEGRYATGKNIYSIDNEPQSEIKRHYYGEYGTRRQILPATIATNAIGDESSPYRLRALAVQFKGKIGLSSYRETLFTIPTPKQDINVRLPLLPPIFTLKQMDVDYKERHSFLWLDLKLNTHYCYLRKTYLSPEDEKNGVKNWSAKPFLRIPLDYHIKAMLQYADETKKEVIIYADDYDVPIEDVIARLNIVNKYLIG